MEQQSLYDYEKLGLMYLGKELDLDTGESSSQALLYRNKHLTTHGVIIGMTGSGKTGLGIGLIEEAVLDNVPSIIIDPKGDMGNLALAFPACCPEDFLPWVDPAEAIRKEMSVKDFATATSTVWREGLASWGQNKERIKTFSTKSNLTIYTPGSSAGVQVSVLGSFKAPAAGILNDNDTLNSLVNTTATSLLGLVDVGGDPLQSREHILLSSLLLHHWRKGTDLSMESLIGGIVSPPFEKVGVFGLDTFYPQSERMLLAMTLNNILASPTFSAWTRGEPLDIQRILYTSEGAPRTSVFSIAHLSDSERMFFVTMLLNQFVGWMRNQQGSSSLKALLYMDEIYGYFPPTANPPSKKPMLLLLKQARAFGVGVVLATQNPVDLDYKGLANIGSWFVGRLQTRQDQEKVVEGIASASKGKLDRKKVRAVLANLKGRQFLLNSVHLEEPLLFATRWVMSFLKGPVSKADIKRLMDSRKGNIEGSAISSVSESTSTGSSQLEQCNNTGVEPVISEKIEQLYLLDNVARDEIIFSPSLLAGASVRFYNAKRNIDIVTTEAVIIYLDEKKSRVDWGAGEPVADVWEECVEVAPSGSRYLPLSQKITNQKNFRSFKKEYADYLYQSRKLELFRVKGIALESEPGESLVDFKIRIADRLRELRERALDKLRDKYKNKQRQLQSRYERGLDKLDKEKQDVREKTTDSIISIGTALLGAFFGRKKMSGTTISRTASGVRKAGRVSKEKGDVKRAQDYVREVQGQIDELALELEDKIAAITVSHNSDNYEVETFSIKPRRADIFDLRVVLLWVGKN